MFYLHFLLTGKLVASGCLSDFKTINCNPHFTFVLIIILLMPLRNNICFKLVYFVLKV